MLTTARPVSYTHLLALYTRLLYSKVQERRKEERRAQKEAENEIRYPHKKKKR